MRSALVTGGSTGIGQSICQHLLDSGYRVINVSRRPSPIEHQHLHNYSADLADPAATDYFRNLPAHWNLSGELILRHFASIKKSLR